MSVVRILLAVPGPIDPAQSAGSRLVADLFEGLGELGHEVEYCFDDDTPTATVCATWEPDVVIISWAGIAARLLPVLQPSSAALIYLGHDLAHRRVAAGDEIATPAWDRRSEVVRIIEERSWGLADLSIYPEQTEADYVESVAGEGSAMAMIPYLIDEGRLRSLSDGTGRDVCFVGGPLHAPNRDAVRWFRDQVHRELFRTGELGKFHVFGYWTPEDLEDDLEGIVLHGPLSDEELDDQMSACALAVAPLRFGAGVKRKVVHYLSLSLPLVASGVAMEGIHPDPLGVELCSIAETPDEWRAVLLALRDDKDLRRTQAEAGLRAVTAGYTRAAYHQNLDAVLGTALERRQRRGGNVGGAI